MKLAWMREDLASARRAFTFLLALLLGSMLTNLILAAFAFRMSSRERIVLVPPTIHKTFWVEDEHVSAEYLEQMGYFLMQLTLNVTPLSIDHQSKVLLQYAAPVAYGELRTALAAAAERLKRDGAATVFSPRDLIVDERSLKVGIRGQLTTFISDRRVSEVAKGYAIEFQYTAGRIFLKSFRETNPNDPLETKPSPASSPAGT
ncbi:MAG: type IV conjugative transfer system protein TraE [Burkholderiales bacterium]|nr:type IV conjugative transfer system protein TraE [Burkholderiales bacterium]